MERKVGVGGIGAAFGILVVWITGEANLNFLNWTPEAAAAVSTVIGVVIGYLVPNPK